MILDVYIDYLVYLIALALSMYGLSALDYNRFIKASKPMRAQTLYLILAFVLAYLLGSMILTFIRIFR